MILLQIKHWYVDFVNQTDKEVQCKGTYLHWQGLKHSLKHGIATFSVFLIFFNFYISSVVGIIDFLLHYHIDYCKMRFGNRDIKTKQFWIQLGLDQLAHQITYLGLVLLVI